MLVSTTENGGMEGRRVFCEEAGLGELASRNAVLAIRARLIWARFIGSFGSYDLAVKVTSMSTFPILNVLGSYETAPLHV